MTHFDTTTDRTRLGATTACGRPIFRGAGSPQNGVHPRNLTTRRTGKHAPTCPVCATATR